MSGNHRNEGSRLDRRVRRTREALGDAMIALLLEKPFEDVTVQQVLDRAGVARSTFYKHFRDKNDLLLSDIDDFFAFMAGLPLGDETRGMRIAPVRELLSHLAESEALYAALLDSGKLRDALELARGHFARAIEARLASSPRTRSLSPKTLSAVAYTQAGALLSLMDWWLAHGRPTPPETMDELFHRMLWSGIAHPTADPGSVR